MKFGLPQAAALSILAASLYAPAAQALDCPAAAVVGDAAQAEAIASTLGNPTFDDTGWLTDAVDSLIARGISRASVVDNMFAAYCRQQVAAGLTGAAATANLRSFAARVTQIAYTGGSDGGSAGDTVILNVPFDAATSKKIDEQAKAAGVTPEAWVAQAIGEDLD